MKLSPTQKGVLLEEGREVYGAASFGRDAARQFPDLASDFEEDLELLHVHMATLAGLVRDAIADGDLDTVARVGAFLDTVLEHPGAVSEIENAVAISFVDAREFRSLPHGSEAFRCLPGGVRRILKEQARRDEGAA